jgi:surfactin synthase thioesterase subunit
MKTTIIALPFAGGNKYSFRDLKKYLDQEFDLVTLELPGRGDRFDEALLSDIHQMVEDLYTQILPFINNSYVLYAHSMGGILGNLLIRKLAGENKNLPLHFLASGCKGPINNPNRRKLAHLNDGKLAQALQKLGGLPPAVLEIQELLELFLPIIRADIRALEEYDYQQQSPYNVPVTAMAGLSEEIDESALSDWQLETTQPLRMRWFEGNHFFILDHLDSIADLLMQSSCAYDKQDGTK